MHNRWTPFIAYLALATLAPAAAWAQEEPAVAPTNAPTAASATAPVSAPASAPSAGSIESARGRLSYAVGVQFANSVQADGVDLDMDLFMRAMRDVMEGQPQAMDEAEVLVEVQAFRQQLQAKLRAKQMEQARKTLQDGMAYLNAYAQRDGVTVLPSGLSYRVLVEGTGPAPTEQDKVRVHYRGTLIDGTEFDSSRARGTPAEFGVTQVIQGWQEALQLMPAGARWEVVIPPQLAYGSQGAGQGIPPNATLIFDVELIEVITTTAPASAPTE